MYQKTTIVGRLGRDAESKELNGQKFFQMSIAVDSGYMDRTTNQYVEKTTWYNTVVWRELKTNHLKKGAIVLVEGELTPRYYTSQDGKIMLDMKLKGENYKILVFVKDNVASSSDNQSSIANNPNEPF